MIAGAIFDVDGTILDSMPIWDTAGSKYLISQSRIPQADLAEVLFTMSMEEAAIFLQKQYELTNSVAQIVQGINQVIEQYYWEEAPLKSGAYEFLREMYLAKIPMTIATATDFELVSQALKRLNVYDFFDHIFTCTDIGASKEKPRIYLAARNYMNTATEETWVFEDSMYAVQTATKAGFPVVALYDQASEGDQKQIMSLANDYWEQWKEFRDFDKMNGRIQ